MTGKILPMITITSMILFLFCYCVYINVESMYTQDVFKSKCWCWLDPFLHQLIWQTSNQKQLLRVFSRPNPPAGRFGQLGRITYSIPASRQQNNPPFQPTSSVFLVKAFIPCLPFTFWANIATVKFTRNN